MPVLKDVQCPRCGNVVERLVDGGETSIIARCAECRAMTRHATICNGGMKSRYRCNDLSESYVEDAYRLRRVEAYTLDADGNEVPATDFNTGKDLTEASGVNDPERRAAQRERTTWKHRRRKGRTPIHIDLKQPRRRGRQPRGAASA